MRMHLLISAAILLSVADKAQSQGVEPTAGTWHTWAISNLASYRLPPPPSHGQSQAEAKKLEMLALQRDAEAVAAVRFFDSGSPAYRWIQTAQQEVTSHNLGGPRGTRAMSLVAVALNDTMIAAWDSKYAYNRLRPTEIDKQLTTLIAVPHSPSYPSEHAAAAGVAAAVLGYLFPDHKANFDSMAESAGQSRLIAGTEFPSDVSAGLSLGQSIGDAVIARAKSDGFDSVFIGSFPPMTGVWSNSNPVYPLAGSWKPWALSSGSQLRLPPPPDFGTDEFQAQVNALKQFGRTVASNHTAWFWQPSFIDPWIDSVNQLLFENHLDRNPPKAAQIYALVMIAQHDASIACWDTKYSYLELRPTMADAAITTLFPTPAHPSYPSGHACASAAAAGALSAVFPDSASAFVDRGREAGLSTFYAGIHFLIDVDQGLVLGNAVAQIVVHQAGVAQ